MGQLLEQTDDRQTKRREWIAVALIGLTLIGAVIWIERQRQKIPTWIEGLRVRLEQWD